MIDIVKKTWKKSRPFKMPFPPHDESHNNKVQERLFQLLPDEEKLKEVFSDDERFLLLAAVWLHDIGMVPELFRDDPPANWNEDSLKAWERNNLRKTHNERSAKFISSSNDLKVPVDLKLTPSESDRLSTIALLHRKSEKIPENLDDKIRLIVAYLRLADALHIPDRAPIRDLKSYLSNMDAVSKFHWFKSFYVIDTKSSPDEFNLTLLD